MWFRYVRRDGYLIGFCFSGHLIVCVCTTLLKLSRLAFTGFRFSRFESSRNDQKRYIICKTTWLNVISPGLIMTVRFFAARSNHAIVWCVLECTAMSPCAQFIYHTVVIHVYNFSNYVSGFFNGHSFAHPLSS